MPSATIPNIISEIVADMVVRDIGNGFVQFITISIYKYTINMIYLLFIKTFRVWSFLTFFASVLVFGVENGAGLDSIANLDAWNELKTPVVFSLGFWIAINFGSIFLTRFDRFVLCAYFDNHFTYVIDGEIRETLNSNNFWNHTWPCLREMDDFEVYYNDATASKRLNRLF